MLRILKFDVHTVRLPFRFAFKHSLASRRYSENVIVRVTCENANGAVYVGHGECIPRDYVTGESVESAVNQIKDSYAPAFINRQFSSQEQLQAALLEGESPKQGASFCAFELALLDAWGRVSGASLIEMFGGPSPLGSAGIEYGAVVPFGGKNALVAMLWFYKFYGFRTVKLKVGVDLETDLAKVRLARRIMGEEAIIRADANCAWTVDKTIRFVEMSGPFNLASIEQPIPAGDIDALRRVTDAIPIPVVADESLCTVSDAVTLSDARAVKAFNIRISKVGGLAAAKEIARIARVHGIECHMGAQVGESGILSAVGRSFAATESRLANCEGSNNFFLLKRDLTDENLNVGPKGIGKILSGAGNGVSVREDRLTEMTIDRAAVVDGIRIQKLKV